jgi:hypothetical protein
VADQTTSLPDLPADRLAAYRDEQQAAYDALLARGLSLDLTRGKPSTEQLDLSDGLLALPTTVRDADGVDVRNYGGLQGIREIREIFGELLGIGADQLVAGGSSSLVMMRETLVDLWLHGGVDSERPWAAEEKVTSSAPCPATTATSRC